MQDRITIATDMARERLAEAGLGVRNVRYPTEAANGSVNLVVTLTVSAADIDAQIEMLRERGVESQSITDKVRAKIRAMTPEQADAALASLVAFIEGDSVVAPDERLTGQDLHERLAELREMMPHICDRERVELAALTELLNSREEIAELKSQRSSLCEEIYRLQRERGVERKAENARPVSGERLSDDHIGSLAEDFDYRARDERAMALEIRDSRAAIARVEALVQRMRTSARRVSSGSALADDIEAALRGERSGR